MIQFAQVSNNLFISVDQIEMFYIKLNKMQDMIECYYSITYDHHNLSISLCDNGIVPIKFQSEDEAVDYLKRYIDNGFRLLD